MASTQATDDDESERGADVDDRDELDDARTGAKRQTDGARSGDVVQGREEHRAWAPGRLRRVDDVRDGGGQRSWERVAAGEADGDERLPPDAEAHARARSMQRSTGELDGGRQEQKVVTLAWMDTSRTGRRRIETTSWSTCLCS